MSAGRMKEHVWMLSGSLQNDSTTSNSTCRLKVVLNTLKFICHKHKWPCTAYIIVKRRPVKALVTLLYEKRGPFGFANIHIFVSQSFHCSLRNKFPVLTESLFVMLPFSKGQYNRNFWGVLHILGVLTQLIFTQGYTSAQIGLCLLISGAILTFLTLIYNQYMNHTTQVVWEKEKVWW